VQSATHSQLPFAAQTNGASHVPHDPPQPSSPQIRFVQSPRQSVHRPTTVSQSGVGAAQSPHEPPQPSSPHICSEQSATHAGIQVPATLHTSPAPQSPQEPPQPSTPQLRSAHIGTQSVGAGAL
jgi:hypothetical protein